MLKIVVLQIVATLIGAIFAGLVWQGFKGTGLAAGFSAAFGGAACIVPNVLFALRLSWGAKRGAAASVAGFFAGEFVKLALTVAILAFVAVKYHELNWLALLIGFIVALKSYLLLFLTDQN